MRNNLTDEPSLNTKADVLDFIISFLMEHEKYMDQTLQRIERIAETMSRNIRRTEHIPIPNPQTGLQPHAFTLTITNPDSFNELKSLKIEWGAKRGDDDDINPDVDVIVRKFERSRGKD